ncbi:oxaloacetate decarboxylase subunit gamma [Motilimonas pumila]|uniref:Probable oxaloacetate decarboxylase gamma chain n=1 Tax=Motilimonas pumila TaxID=2303987 RepID=A0A418YKR5_9GAMM|nr:oxaloacetate decarboxylase subunit gamma [Motilimonas pumila]RJG51571.1 oxaloacetate decarboxylase subunit gamma [Motilimonas pumila]
MDISELLLQAGNLMLVGMVSVFLFLGLLVLVVQSVAKLVPADELPVASNKPTTQAPAAQASNQVNPKLIAAISTAVQQYRNNN